MMAGVAALERTTFRTSRLLEFCSRKELIAQTGHEPDAWPLVVKAVLDVTGLSRAPLSRLLNGANTFDREAVASLLQAMAANSKPVRPEALGIIGEDHLRARFEAAGCAMDSFHCKTVKDRPTACPGSSKRPSRGGQHNSRMPEKTAGAPTAS